MKNIPDDALVIRGGRNRPEDIRRATATHPSGITGVSVESTVGATVEQLAAATPHGQIGVTTVGKVRAAGGDVIPTSGRSRNHATLTGLTADQASRLMTPTRSNPAKGKTGGSEIMSKPTIHADFNNAGPQGGIRLNTIGTIEDLSRQGIQLREGMQLLLQDEELEADGEVRFSMEEKTWIAVINWQAVRQKQA